MEIILIKNQVDIGEVARCEKWNENPLMFFGDEFSQRKSYKNQYNFFTNAVHLILSIKMRQ